MHPAGNNCHYVQAVMGALTSCCMHKAAGLRRFIVNHIQMISPHEDTSSFGLPRSRRGRLDIIGSKLSKCVAQSEPATAASRIQAIAFLCKPSTVLVLLQVALQRLLDVSVPVRCCVIDALFDIKHEHKPASITSTPSMSSKRFSVRYLLPIGYTYMYMYVHTAWA